MPGWNTAPFLQSLGWATLNSIWQMALLWLVYLLLTHFLPISSFRKYVGAAASVFAGFAWFLYTFVSFYFFGEKMGASVSSLLPPVGSSLPVILSSASMAYLALFIVPACQLVRNWRFIRRIKRHGMQKVSFQSRLFVERYSRLLGIGKKVQVYLSHMVTSPVTLGFLKPVILLPLSLISNLSPAQVEAILLHELTHIRRHDYLVNFLLSIIHVVLYFNPFVKMFLKQVESERENCCDEMVLQFGYDKLSYASALLQLEKNAQQVQLAMGAANKTNLLNRIETIVGMKRKQQLRTIELGGIVAGLFMFLLVNSLVFNKREALPADFSATSLLQPSAFFVDDAPGEDTRNIARRSQEKGKTVPYAATAPSQRAPHFTAPGTGAWQQLFWEAAPAGVVHASFEVIDEIAPLDEAQKEQVKETVAQTKKVLQLQWKEVDTQIADGMTAPEKKKAKQEYLAEIERIDWKKIESKLASEYDDIDWNRVNGNVSAAIDRARMDSMENCYKRAIEELEKARSCGTPDALPIPDVSEQQLKQTGTTLKNKLRELQNVRTKKIIRL